MEVTTLLSNEVLLLDVLAYVMLFCGALTVFAMCFLNAPYGRYTSAAWGIAMPGRLAWFLQELPAFTAVSYFMFIRKEQDLPVSNVILLSLFLFHYTQRTFLFPFLIRGGKPTPVIVFVLAFVFCLWNGYMQARSLTLHTLPQDWHYSSQFIFGVALFVVGLCINIHSDHVLRNLRKPGETGYKVPHGGMFEFVSGANFVGEIVEWTGFAVACSSLHSVAFAVFTACNLAPRALSHHQWYLKKFPEVYPKSRKALIPFLL